MRKGDKLALISGITRKRSRRITQPKERREQPPNHNPRRHHQPSPRPQHPCRRTRNRPLRMWSPSSLTRGPGCLPKAPDHDHHCDHRWCIKSTPGCQPRGLKTNCWALCIGCKVPRSGDKGHIPDWIELVVDEYDCGVEWSVELVEEWWGQG